MRVLGMRLYNRKLHCYSTLPNPKHLQELEAEMQEEDNEREGEASQYEPVKS